MRRKGQHFLVDQGVLSRIAGYAALSPEDCVLEVGPGTGNLTEVLSSKAGRVVAIEVDPALAEGLRGRFLNVSIIKGDALKLPLPECNKVVSNLPYQISSKFIRRLALARLDLAVLMVQKEFAERMRAKAGSKDYSALSMISGYSWDVEVLEQVSRRAFSPQPEVGSAIVRLIPRKGRLDVDASSFIRLADGLFTHRRKKIRNTLESMKVPAGALAGIDPAILERRPEDISPDEAAGVAAAISQAGD